MVSVRQCVRGQGLGWEIECIYSLVYRVALRPIKVINCWCTSESLGTKYVLLISGQRETQRNSGCSWGWEKECSERLYPQVYDHIPSCVQAYWIGPMVLEYKTLQSVNQGNFLLFSVVVLDVVVG